MSRKEPETGTFQVKLNIVTAKLRRWEAALGIFRCEAETYWEWGRKWGGAGHGGLCLSG